MDIRVSPASSNDGVACVDKIRLINVLHDILDQLMFMAPQHCQMKH